MASGLGGGRDGVVAGSSVRDKERGVGHVSEDVGALPECDVID